MKASHSRRALVGACLLFIGSSVSHLNISHAKTLVAAESGSDLIRRIRFRVIFRNPFAHSLIDQKFWCYLPLQSETQVVKRVDVSMEHQIYSDGFGHQILELSFGEIPGYLQKTVTLEIDVRFELGQASTSAFDKLDWLASERLMESDATQIVTLANKLRRGSNGYTLEMIYRWVSENIEYAGFVPEDLGALYAIENRRGDCTEYAYLVVALARANKIPARVLGGYFAEHDIAPKPQDYHNWAEVFVDGRWRIVDAQKGYLFPTPGRYMAFRIHHQIPINHIGSAHRYRLEGQLQVGF